MPRAWKGSTERTRGVYATPRPLTRFVVRSVDFLLRSRLGLERGLADPAVRLLDPAAGPANFRRQDSCRERDTQIAWSINRGC